MTDHGHGQGIRAGLVVVALGILITAGALATRSAVRSANPFQPEAKKAGWTRIPPSSIKARDPGPTVWTGSEMIIFGGAGEWFGDSDEQASLVDVIAYNPSRHSWRELAPPPFDRTPSLVVWTGAEVFAWAQIDDRFENRFEYHGAALDLRGNTWRGVKGEHLRGRAWGSVLWTGREILTWGGSGDFTRGDTTVFLDGVAFDPVKDSVRRIPPAPVKTSGPVWTGTEMLVWSNGDATSFGRRESQAVAWSPRTNRWRRVGGTPPIRRDLIADTVWTGKELLVWGHVLPIYTGMQSPDDKPQRTSPDLNEAAALDPATGIWRGLPSGPLKSRRGYASAWTGREWIVWGGIHDDGTLGEFLNDGAAFDPSTGAWRVLEPGPLSSRFNPASVWTGEEFVVWGGMARAKPKSGLYSTAPLNDGANYRPRSS